MNRNGTLDEILQEMLSETIKKVVRAELNKFFDERFKSDNGSIQSVHNNIDDLRNRGLKNLQDSVNALRGEVNALKGDVGGVRREISELAEIRKPDGILTTIGKTVSNIFQSNEDEIRKLQQDLKDRESKIEEARRIYEERTRELERVRRESDIQIQQLQNDTQRISAELSTKQSELSRAQNEMSKKRSELSKMQEELSRVNGDVKNLQNQLTDTEEQLNQARASEQESGEKLKAWKNSTGIYSPVREAITKCPTFAAIVNDYGLGDMSETGLMDYAQALGKNTEDFAYAIWKMARDVKKQTKELMTPEEAAVYVALNNVYRQIWNIAHDIFELPGKKPIMENFSKTTFDFATSIFIGDPRKSLTYTTGVYVPILMSRENRLAQKAYVEASNS